METKKNVSSDIYKKTNLFFSIGLMIALGIVLSAFEWSGKYDDHNIIVEPEYDPLDDLMPDVKSTRQEPKIPEVRNPKILEVKDEIKPDEVKVVLTFDPNEFTPPEPEISPEPETEETELPFVFVEDPAMPKGGWKAYYLFIRENLKYPAQARRMGIEGKVFVEFIVLKDGSLSDVKVIKGIGAGCDEEAARVIQMSPPWNPGKQRGKPVKQRYTLPVFFQLD